jgi:hypothetical protein
MRLKRQATRLSRSGCYECTQKACFKRYPHISCVRWVWLLHPSSNQPASAFITLLKALMVELGFFVFILPYTILFTIGYSIK